MSVRCPSCNKENTPTSRYCADCGVALAIAAPKRTPGLVANAALVFAAALSLITATAAFPPGFASADRLRNRANVFLEASRPGSGLIQPWNEMWRYLGDGSNHITVRRNLDFRSGKAEAMFNLLRPSDVKVVVGERDGGVFIQGTEWEIEVLERFAEVVNRMDGQDTDLVRELRNRAPELREHYKLPAEKRKALYALLATGDVPLGVSVERDGVSVTATEQDQRTVRHLVQILRGVRPRPCDEDCFSGKHVPGCEMISFERTFHDGHGHLPPATAPKPPAEPRWRDR